MSNLSKLGDVYFTEVENEDYNYSNDITSNPVEDGSTVSDNVHSNPISIQISGILIGRTAYPQEKLIILRNYALNGDIISYNGIQGFEKCIIESFDNKHSVDVANGITFDITLKIISIASKQTINVNVTSLNIPDIEALKDQMSADKAADKAAAKAAAGVRVNGMISKGRQTKKKATATSTKAKKSTSVLQKIIDKYSY
jgi:hypothetical protein